MKGDSPTGAHAGAGTGRVWQSQVWVTATSWRVWREVSRRHASRIILARAAVRVCMFVMKTLPLDEETYGRLKAWKRVASWTWSLTRVVKGFASVNSAFALPVPP